MFNIQLLSTSEKICSTFGQIIKKPEFYVLLILLAIYSVYMFLSQEHTLSDDITAKLTSDFIGSLIELATLLVVFSVWIYEIRREWADSLQKFLSVRFITPSGKVRIECLYAPLIGESDVRTMAQALGKSANGNNNLPIEQMLSKITTQIVKDAAYLINDGKVFKSYEVEIRLTAMIGEIKRNQEAALSLSDNQYLYWANPFGPITENNIKPLPGTDNGYD